MLGPLFRTFNTSKAAKDAKTSSMEFTAGTSSTDFADKSSSKEFKAGQTRTKTKSKKEVAPPSPAVEAMEAFLRILNQGNYEDLTSLFENVYGDIHFEDAKMSLVDYIEEMVRCRKVFPDLHFEWATISSKKNGLQAIVRGFRASGTHSGPYGFGPYPEIPATSIKCRNDPEEVCLWLDEKSGKIRKVMFIPKGPMTGPPGFYQQIGGIIF